MPSVFRWLNRCLSLRYDLGSGQSFRKFIQNNGALAAWVLSEKRASPNRLSHRLVSRRQGCSEFFFVSFLYQCCSVARTFRCLSISRELGRPGVELGPMKVRILFAIASATKGATASPICLNAFVLKPAKRNLSGKDWIL